MEQWTNIKFSMKIGASATETSSVLNGTGREDLQFDSRSGQPKTQRRDANTK
jgi:hypothetical protein